MSPGTALWPATPSAFAKRLEILVRTATCRPGPYTPGSLRTGGATHMFLEWNEDLMKLCWRGRWRDLHTVWHYIQELQSLSVLQQYPREVQGRVSELSSLLDALAREPTKEISGEGA